MGELNYQKNYSLVTAILPRQTARDIVEAAISAYPDTGVMLSSRGSLVKDGFLQKLIPAVNPEQTVVELLVDESSVDKLMNGITIAGRLHQSGAGAVFSMKCDNVLFLGNQKGEVATKSQDTSDSIDYKQDMTGIFCISQKDKSDPIAKAAMREGSPGPTVVFGQGRGIRERMGLLRIAISPEKELIRVVVDSYDTEPVFNAMVDEGKLDTPGMGFIYSMPVEKALVNIASVVNNDSNLASNHQIVKAIDEIKGGAGWRAQSVGDGSDPPSERKFLTDLTRLTCVTERGKGDAMVDAAMAAGAPGASIAYGTKLGEEESVGGIALSKEMEVIEMTLSPKITYLIVGKMAEAAEADGNSDVYFYAQPVPKALTYLG